MVLTESILNLNKTLNKILITIDEGRQFDLNGNIVDWWEDETETEFVAKAKCIIEQYENFTDIRTNMTINGINTQGENIADNGGVKQAYLAYKKFIMETGDEPKLPGLDFSSKQLFWLAAAQTECDVSRPGEIIGITTFYNHYLIIF